MIISRTPLRVSFVGGGSDLPAFYRQHDGAVLSMSVKKYVYLSMHEYFERQGCILKYSEIEKPRTADEIQHRIIQQVFRDLAIDRVDFNSSADVPAGTGMGRYREITLEAPDYQPMEFWSSDAQAEEDLAAWLATKTETSGGEGGGFGTVFSMPDTEDGASAG